MSDKKDKDLTPTEPLMQRKRTSQSMPAIGWRTCPACEGVEGTWCTVCFDPESNTFARRLPPDQYIKWIQAQEKKDIETHDTEPAMAAVRVPDTERTPGK